MRWYVWPLTLSACLQGGQVTQETSPPTCDDMVAPWFADEDGDGHGDPAQPVCPDTPGAVVDDTDCDDADAAVHPGRTEICAVGPARDDDCDPRTPDPVASVGDLPFDTLSEAVALDADGPRTVVVCDGQKLAVSPLGLQGVLTVRSASGLPERVTLTTASGPIFQLSDDQTSLTLLGITIAGGQGEVGGAIMGATFGITGPLLHGEVTLADVFAKNNEALMGGVVAARVVTVQSSELTGNVALDDGGAVFADHAIVEDSVLSGNSAFRGGAVALRVAGMLTGSTFSGNDARALGGAVHASHPGGESHRTLDLTGSTFTDNEARMSGGAVYVRDFHTVDATGASFVENLAQSLENSSSGTGGAVFVDALAPPAGTTFLGGSFLRNEAPDGGGVYVVCSAREPVVFEQLFAEGNIANAGAALYFHNGCRGDLRSPVVQSNTATFVGGAAYVGLGDTTLQITKGTLTDNVAQLGGALFLEVGADATLQSTTLHRNWATIGHSGAIHALPDPGLSLSFVDVDTGVDIDDNDNGTVDATMAPWDAASPDASWSLEVGYLASHECDFLGCYTPPTK